MNADKPAPGPARVGLDVASRSMNRNWPRRFGKPGMDIDSLEARRLWARAW
jgi:hypothetical protein